MRRPYLGAISELVFGEVDLSERAFAYELPKSIVSDILEILVRELAVGISRLTQSSKSRRLHECVTLTQGALGMTWQAIQQSSSQHKVTLQDFPRIPKNTLAFRSCASAFALFVCISSSARCEDCVQSRPRPPGLTRARNQRHGITFLTEVSVVLFEVRWKDGDRRLGELCSWANVPSARQDSKRVESSFRGAKDRGGIAKLRRN